MSKFLLRRFFFAVVVIIIGTFVTYAVMRMLPMSFVEAQARALSAKPGSEPYQLWLDQLNVMYGLNRGIFAGFARWLQNAVKGEFGDSWWFTVPVVDKFKSVVWISIIMSASSLIFELIVSIPLGILAARKQYSPTDYGVTVFALIGISLPSFFFASLLRYIFAVKLHLFEIMGLVSRNYPFYTPFGQTMDKAWHLVLPVATLMMLSIGGLMRYTRTNMLEVLNSDYIRTARAKGLSEKRVINSHAFRNTLIPLVTYFSYLLPSLFSGAMITEQIFGITGVGQAGYQALSNGDIPFTMFYMAFTIILTQVSLIIADMMYAVVDPRVRIN
jgi:peptide/nickel transport system permease protein